jgi:hypothetical protein
MDNTVFENDVRAELRALVSESGSVTKVAAQLDFGYNFISDVLAGRRSVSAALAKKLGYERVYAFVAMPDTAHIVPNPEDYPVAPASDAAGGIRASAPFQFQADE